MVKEEKKRKKGGTWDQGKAPFLTVRKKESTSLNDFGWGRLSFFNQTLCGFVMATIVERGYCNPLLHGVQTNEKAFWLATKNSNHQGRERRSLNKIWLFLVRPNKKNSQRGNSTASGCCKPAQCQGLLHIMNVDARFFQPHDEI